MTLGPARALPLLWTWEIWARARVLTFTRCFYGNNLLSVAFRMRYGSGKPITCARASRALNSARTDWTPHGRNVALLLLLLFSNTRSKESWVNTWHKKIFFTGLYENAKSTRSGACAVGLSREFTAVTLHNGLLFQHTRNICRAPISAQHDRRILDTWRGGFVLPLVWALSAAVRVRARAADRRRRDTVRFGGRSAPRAVRCRVVCEPQ